MKYQIEIKKISSKKKMVKVLSEDALERLIDHKIKADGFTFKKVKLSLDQTGAYRDSHEGNQITIEKHSEPLPDSVMKFLSF